jgi:hypothetical protein
MKLIRGGQANQNSWAHFLGVPVLKSKIRKFRQNTAQLWLKTVLKVVILNDFLLRVRTHLNKTMICHICEEIKNAFAD